MPWAGFSLGAGVPPTLSGLLFVVVLGPSIASVGGARSGPRLARGEIGGDVFDFPQFRKYQSTISCTDGVPTELVS
jgi:hypothetical protein